METYAAIRDALQWQIKRLRTELARLQGFLTELDDPAEPPAAIPAKSAKRRIRLKDEVAADIRSKIVKAVRAHRDGASRADIVLYLDRCGWQLDHHFSEPHLGKLINSLMTGETTQIRREGERARSRYFLSA